MGAENVTIGTRFAKQLKLTPQDLDPNEEHVTLDGKYQQYLGTTKKVYTITIGHGKNQTLVNAKLHLTPSEKYDVLLGSTFLGPIGGIIDPWSQHSHYRVDWQKQGTHSASIPVKYTLPHAASVHCQYMEEGMTYTSANTFMQIPNEHLLHSTEEADILTEFEFRIMEESIYHEPQNFPNGPIDNEYQPQMQEWETNTMVYLATTKHTDIRQAHRPQFNAAARTMNTTQSTDLQPCVSTTHFIYASHRQSTEPAITTMECMERYNDSRSSTNSSILHSTLTTQGDAGWFTHLGTIWRHELQWRHHAPRIKKQHWYVYTQ